MSYAFVKNGKILKFPYSPTQFKADNPLTSFPKMSDEDWADFGVFRVWSLPKPQKLSKKQKADQQKTPSIVEGVPVFDWSIRDKTPEEIESDKNLVRKERNVALANTDWMALGDNMLTSEWATYRQALRDITDHTNFPWLNDEDWPVPPE